VLPPDHWLSGRDWRNSLVCADRAEEYIFTMLEGLSRAAVEVATA
jgi:hypothetical protein